MLTDIVSERVFWFAAVAAAAGMCVFLVPLSLTCQCMENRRRRSRLQGPLYLYVVVVVVVVVQPVLPLSAPPSPRPIRDPNLYGPRGHNYCYYSIFTDKCALGQRREVFTSSLSRQHAGQDQVAPLQLLYWALCLIRSASSALVPFRWKRLSSLFLLVLRLFKKANVVEW